MCNDLDDVGTLLEPPAEEQPADLISCSSMVNESPNNAAAVVSGSLLMEQSNHPARRHGAEGDELGVEEPDVPFLVVRKRITCRRPRPVVDAITLEELIAEADQTADAGIPLHAIKREFLNDFVSLETRMATVAQNERDMTLRDVNAIGNRSIEQLSVQDVVEAVWHLARYLETMPTSLISADVCGGVLGIIEMDASAEEREDALANLVISIPRDDYVVLKAVIGHARRLAELSPYEMVRGLSSTISHLTFPTPNDANLKRPPASSQREDWETAVAAAAAAIEESQVMQKQQDGDGSVQKRRASMIVQMASEKQLQELAARVVASVEGEGAVGSRDVEGVVATHGGDNGTSETAQQDTRRASLSVPGFRNDFPSATPFVLPPSPTPRRLGTKRTSETIHEEAGSSDEEGRVSEVVLEVSENEEEDVKLEKKDIPTAIFAQEAVLPAAGVAMQIMIEYYADFFHTM
ncbi:hypothetical protein HK097_003068 [Rhizophlyctis rosea]|uniref:Uncharacterized protein n=1 Tax=Rhizophlyctis rosea TaxID=64517 RepID=A0AAD5X7K5_9FUNG|nr:hypothetical protein HK097_003068 [Rhizophlyctis rosea]